MGQGSRPEHAQFEFEFKPVRAGSFFARKNAGPRAKPAGFRAKPAGFRAEPAGFRAEPAGFRAEPAGSRAVNEPKSALLWRIVRCVVCFVYAGVYYAYIRA